MVLNSKPIPVLPNPDVVVRMPPGKSGFILHQKGRRHYWEGTGLLSVKSFFGGQAFYNTGKGLHVVNDNSYLVLNDRQPYSITIESEQVIECFCIFFRAELAEDVFRSLNSKPEKLLDDPAPVQQSKINFFDKTYPHDSVLSPTLVSLKSSFAERKNQPGWLEEQMHCLMQLLLEAHCKTLREASSINAVRPATREELYRRLFRAKDFIVASFDRPVTLNEMANVACLSPNHFLRSFRQAFHQTPHQFLISIRLDYARNALIKTEQPVTDICFAVGFESLSSFSRLFHRRFGLPPQEYRRLKR